MLPSFRPSHGQPKLTFVSKKMKRKLQCNKKQKVPEVFKIELHLISYEKKLFEVGSSILKTSGTFCFFVTPQSPFYLFWNVGQLLPPVTRPLTPSTYTYSEPSGHEDSPGGTQNIPYLFKIWVNRDWAICFLGFFGDFWGREHCEFSDFQNLSVFSNFLAWNHIVCHRSR